MKKIFLIGMLCMSLFQSFACDICGCSSPNYFIGPFPQFLKHFFGIRYTFRSFNTQLANDPTQFSKDFYQTIELWSGWNIGKRWQLLAFLPYNINQQISDDGIKKSNGLGDITLIANYDLFNKRSGDKRGEMITQQLLIGAGVKLPTGKFTVDPTDLIATANDQVGTGSVDYILNAMYTYHVNNWGVNGNMNYKINTSANGYKFGNRLSSSAFVFRSVTAGKTTFNPNLGLLYEKLGANKLEGSKVDQTGGDALMASGGVEINFHKVIAGLNMQLPVTQNLSEGQTTSKVRGMVHVTFIL